MSVTGEESESYRATPYPQSSVLTRKSGSDVQLLVVNRKSLAEGKPRLCGIGEKGELFVRAGGLAEGWLISPQYLIQRLLLPE